MKLSDLNGDSTVSNIIFKDGCVRCHFKDGDTREEYALSIPTCKFYSDAMFKSELGCEYMHIRIIDLKEKLSIEPTSLMYCAPPAFGPQMQAAHKGFLLAVGLKSSEWPLLLQIRGSLLLVACPIQSESSVRVEKLNGCQRS